MNQIKTNEYKGKMDTENVADCKIQKCINGYTIYALDANADEFLVTIEDSEFMLIDTSLKEVIEYLEAN
jgi:hypothetical protein